MSTTTTLPVPLAREPEFIPPRHTLVLAPTKNGCEQVRKLAEGHVALGTVQSSLTINHGVLRLHTGIGDAPFEGLIVDVAMFATRDIGPGSIGAIGAAIRFIEQQCRSCPSLRFVAIRVASCARDEVAPAASLKILGRRVGTAAWRFDATPRPM